MRSALFTAIGSLAIVLLFSFLFSWPIFMLWNGCLVGAVTGVNDITWLQAWGIAILTGMLFKNNNSARD